MTWSEFQIDFYGALDARSSFIRFVFSFFPLWLNYLISLSVKHYTLPLTEAELILELSAQMLGQLKLSQLIVDYEKPWVWMHLKCSIFVLVKKLTKNNTNWEIKSKNSHEWNVIDLVCHVTATQKCMFHFWQMFLQFSFYIQLLIYVSDY